MKNKIEKTFVVGSPNLEEQFVQLIEEVPLNTIGSINAAICGGMNTELPKEMIRKIEAVNQLDFDQLTHDIALFVK